MQQDKIDYLNVAKGIGILLVIVGHALTKKMVSGNSVLGVLRSLIYTVHMPLFFIIAGFLFVRNSDGYLQHGIADFARKKGKLYLVPYLGMTFLVILMFLILSQFPVIHHYFDVPEALENGGISTVKAILFFQNPIDEHLWFAYIMFYVLIIGFWLQCVREKCGKCYIVFMVFLFVLYIFTYCVQTQYVIKKAIRYMMYFQFGCNIDRLKVLKKMPQGKTICMLLLYTMAFGIYQFFFSDNDKLMVVQGLLLLLIGISGSLLIMEFSKLICKKTETIKGLLIRLNNVSYPVYLYHQPFIVSGMVVILSKIGVSTVVIICVATFAGILIPVFVYKAIVQRSSVLRLLFAGGR